MVSVANCGDPLHIAFTPLSLVTSPNPLYNTVMKILVPLPVLEDVRAANISGVTFLPYTEEETETAGIGEAKAVFRWIAGKRYERLLLDGSQVRWLHTASAGVDHILTAALKARGGFILTDSGPAFGICIGEFVLAWMLATAHRLPELIEQQARSEWKALQQEELYGQTIGIIGLGPIGQGIAARCKAFGMRVIGYRRTPITAPNVDEVRTGSDGLVTLLEESDWIIGAAALTDETRAILGAEQFAAMKPTARIINIARGGLLEESALIDALQKGKIAGAILDVFAREPLPADSLLWKMPGVYITPHNAPGWTDGLRRRQLDLFLQNVARFTQGETLEGIVDIERGY